MVEGKVVPGATSQKLNRQILALSLPLAGTQLANIAISTTDTFMMGQLSLGALAGGGLAVVWFNQIRTMAVGLLTPLGNRIASAHSLYESKSRERADSELSAATLQREIRNLSRTGWLLATVSGLVGALVLMAIAYALPFFGQSAEISSAATSMMWLLAPGLVPCLWFQVSRQFCVGLGKPKSLLHITVAMIVVNAALNYALGFGFGPFPALGLLGIGLSTTLVHLLSALIYLRITIRDPDLSTFLALDFWSADGDTMHGRLRHLVRTQLRLGLPVSATYGAEAGMFSVLAMVMGSFGTEALAAHNVVYQITFIVFQIGVGFSHGSSILVSRAWGLNDNSLARQVGIRTQTMMAAIVAVASVSFLCAPRLVLSPFISSSEKSNATETLSIALGLLAIGAVMEFVDTAQNIAIGLLRGISDTTTGLKASLTGYWIIGLPAALILAFPIGLGPHGVWWGLVIGLASSSIILWRAFLLATRKDLTVKL